MDPAVWELLKALVRDEDLRREAAQLAPDQDASQDESEIARCESLLQRDDQFQVALLRQQADGLIRCRHRDGHFSPSRVRDDAARGGYSRVVRSRSRQP